MTGKVVSKLDILNDSSKRKRVNTAIQQISIYLSDIRNECDIMNREDYLSKHNHNVWKGTDGKWRTYLDSENSTRGYVLKVRTTKKALDDLIVNYYKEKELDPFIDKVFEEWINQKLQFGEITKQSYSRYMNDYKRFFPKDCFLCQKKFRQITEIDLEAFIKTTIHNLQLTAKTYSGLRTIILGIFKYGKSRRYTEISITTFFGDLTLSKKSFSKKVIDRESEVFSENEIVKIKSYLQKNPTIRNLGIALAFETGLRVGELSALKKCDIDIGRHVIHIQRTEVTYKDPKTNERVCEVRDVPKTDAGDRYLIIPDSATTILASILQLSRNSEYLFSENGKRIRSNAFNRCLTRICDSLYIKRRSMHKIRKTYGTTLINSHVDESLIAEQMGHKDIATTKKYYYRNNRNDNTRYKQINKALSC